MSRIMIVEDEAIVALDLKRSLERLGYQISSIHASGEDALAFLKESLPDLILMDIMLKGTLDGIETASIIRSTYQIPIIYLSAYSGDWVQNRAQETEPFGYILKPFEERELHTVIEIALYRDRMEKELQQSREWFYTTLKSIGDGVIATNRRGEVEFMNPVAQQLTGWTQKEAKGQPLKDIFHILNERTGERVENPVDRVIEKGVVVGLANNTLLISRYGKRFFIDDSAAPIKDEKGRLTGVVLIFRDISQKKRLQEKERRKRDTIIHQQAQLMDLVKADFHDFSNTVEMITETAAKTLGVERVSLWLFSQDRSIIRCKDLYRLDQDFHESGEILEAKNLPAYFKAINEERCIAITDIRRDPRTKGFEAYSKEQEVISMLDAGIWLYGEPVGVVCHESIKERDWEPHEEQFATSVADIFALALTSPQKAQRVLQEEGGKKIEGEYRSILENLPLGIYRSTITNRGRFIMANPLSLQILGLTTLSQLESRDVASTFQDEREWENILRDLLSSGIIKDLIVKRKRADGRIIQVRHTFQLIDDGEREPLYVDVMMEDIMNL